MNIWTIKSLMLLYKNHSEATKAILSERKNKYPLGVGIYDLDNNLIAKFKNNVELANHLNISKVTVGKYLNSNLIYKNYYFKPIFALRR